MKTAERVTLGLLFGTSGGLLGWLLVDPLFRIIGIPLISDIKYNPATGRWIEQPVHELSFILFPAIIALCIAVALVMADTLSSGSRKRFWRDVGIAGGVGIAAGILGYHLGNVGFNTFLEGKQLQEWYAAMKTGGVALLPRLMIGRALGWMLIGGFLGLAGGMARASTQRMKHGFVGGLIGGFLGGLFFEPFALVFGSGMASRLVSLAVIGGFIGGSIAMVENLFKQAWVVVLLGRNEGRLVILTRDISSIGRDELSDVGIFGDRTVAPRHASIRKESSGYFIVDESNGAGVLVNGQRTSRRLLRDGDVIQIGETKLEFHEKATRSPLVLPDESVPEPALVSPPMPSNICPYCGQARDSATGACECSIPVSAPAASSPLERARLVAVSGPLSGQSFALGPNMLRIGRDDDREICPKTDATVSRRHAVIRQENGSYVIQDEGSSNGTYVNGMRTDRQILHRGDEIRVGETVLRVEM